MPKKYVFDVIADGTSDITIEQDITQVPQIVPGLMAMDLWSNAQTLADIWRFSPRAWATTSARWAAWSGHWPCNRATPPFTRTAARP